MVTVRRHIILVMSIILVLVGAVHGEPQYTATPAVSATAMPYGGTIVTEEEQTPVTPLLVEAISTSGNNSGWAQAAPGRLRASSEILDAPETWFNSQGVCSFVDNFSLVNPAMSDNTTGVFFYRFVLTGTMRIRASDLMSRAFVQVWGSTIMSGGQSGQVTFSRIDGVPTLYAVSGGQSHPADNMLAGPNGEMRVFGTTTTQSGGYYEMHLAVPVDFIFTNFPINTNPPADDWKNQIDFQMSAVSVSNAGCDFSSTFEFSPQNPIVPDPDSGLPVTGWDLGSASNEIALPPPLSVATSTGSGQAGFVAEQGTIVNLEALTLADFPEGLSGGDFAHGWFAMDVNLQDGAGQCDVAISLPGAVGVEAKWWFHDGVGWESIALLDDDGDAQVILQVADNGYGDADPATGVVSLAGGVSADLPTPAFFSVFEAVWRSGAVDLSWRAPAADPSSLSLEAHLDDRSWLVPLSTDARGNFTAHDDAPALYGGGTVRYDLLFDKMLLDSRTVELPGLAIASLDVIAPNPFNPKVQITYTLSRDAGSIELAVHDLAGRRVATLVNGEPGPGQHVAEWEGLDANGQAVPSGVYLVRLATLNRVESRKISLVR